MAQGLLRFSTTGKRILQTFEILKTKSDFSTIALGPGPRPGPRPRPGPWPWPRPWPGPDGPGPGPRTGPGPGPGTVGRTDGRPDGAIYLAKCATPPTGRRNPQSLTWPLHLTARTSTAESCLGNQIYRSTIGCA